MGSYTGFRHLFHLYYRNVVPQSPGFTSCLDGLPNIGREKLGMHLDLSDKVQVCLDPGEQNCLPFQFSLRRFGNVVECFSYCQDMAIKT